MRNETVKRLEKIQRVSVTLRTICGGLIGLAGLIFLLAMAGVLIGRKGIAITAYDLRIPVDSLAIPDRLGLIVLLAMSAGVLLKGLYHLRSLFGIYAKGDVFTVQAAAQIRQLGLTAILWGIVHNVWPFAAYILTHAPKPASFALAWDSFFIGAAIIAISWFMDAAAEIREENDLTI